MSFLYVNEPGAVVGLEGGFFGNAHMAESCVRECLLRGIPVNYFSAGGSYFGRLSSTRYIKADRLRQQVHCSENETFCLEFSKK